MDSAAEIFESHRARLVGLAYRMLGSVSEAHDVVQDVYVKWHSAEHATIRNAQAWLTTVCSRLALNRLASARAQREQYVGQWLPEPLCLPEGSAAERAELDETVSMALLAALSGCRRQSARRTCCMTCLTMPLPRWLRLWA